MSRFKDKFAIISGGASGMGAATAKRFVDSKNERQNQKCLFINLLLLNKWILVK